MPDVRGALTRPIGPLPAWGWGVAIGGGFLLYRFLRTGSAFGTSNGVTSGAPVVVGGGNGGGGNVDITALQEQLAALQAELLAQRQQFEQQGADLGTLIGLIPGSIPPPDTSALEAQIAALQQQIANLQEDVSAIPPPGGDTHTEPPDENPPPNNNPPPGGGGGSVISYIWGIPAEAFNAILARSKAAHQGVAPTYQNVVATYWENQGVPITHGIPTADYNAIAARSRAAHQGVEPTWQNVVGTYFENLKESGKGGPTTL